MGTLDEVGYVYEEAKELMAEREKDYNDSWKDEGLGAMIHSGYKKANQIKVMYENGRFKENAARAKEDILDTINYWVFVYKLREMEEGESK